MHNHTGNRSTIARLAFRFVLVIGIVNFFADFSYEGARSINGAFLASLGASAIAVGMVAGFGELIGFGLRSITGFAADRSRRYLVFALAGYVVNMAAIPILMKLHDNPQRGQSGSIPPVRGPAPRLFRNRRDIS